MCGHSNDNGGDKSANEMVVCGGVGRTIDVVANNNKGYAANDS